MRLKIAMRETEHPPRVRRPVEPSVQGYSGEEGSGMIGQREGTVRFLFGPTWTGLAV
jgi:CTD kinase subunit beta